MMRPRFMSALRVVTLLALAQGCRCSALSDELGDHGFIRCMRADPPAARKLRLGSHQLSVQERVAELTGPLPLRVAAFTGPVGAALTRAEIAELAAQKPALVLVLGGLGDDLDMATGSLAALAALGAPVVLVPGGADRLNVVKQALDGLAESARENLVLAAGLDELRVGRQRFVFVSGAPDGRYAVDAEACGFVANDLEALAERTRDRTGGRPWLISWAAPAGLGLTTIPGAGEIGSVDLAAALVSLNARGGLFAWPEGAPIAPRAGDLVSLVPRLGRSGTLGPDGSRIARGIRMLRVSESDLTLASGPAP